ncbi:lipoprotein [Spiroplasma alleghenense]|uniref:Lipoprotein n=1 Tax=Spiroplasma alleghenense TaxID=216931 RepID=A0A345Z2J9_9MOLU|nr:lipoprotein [Spiroplasma alleghenense]AXK50828.1 hypothetical protein SALLE_v1c01520 [Spiroplasma alleghenense]
MKKLLSILAAATMTVSAPLSVVACKKTDKNLEETEFDYQFWTNKLINELNQVVNSGLQKQLGDLYFQPQKFFENNKYINYENIMKILDGESSMDLKSESIEFKQIDSEIREFIDWNEILKSVNDRIIGEVNYKNILVNGQNPLKNGFEISEITLTEKAAGIVMINFKLDVSVQLRDESGSAFFQKIEYKSTIGIFTDEALVEEINNAISDFNEQLKLSENANNFRFTSSSGNFDENAAQFSQSDHGVQKSFSEFLEKFNNQQSGSSFGNLQINQNQNKYNFQKSAFLSASVVESSVRSKWYLEDNLNTTLKKGLVEGGGALLNTIDLTLDTNDRSDAVMGSRDTIPENVKKNLTSNDAWMFNHLYIKEKIDKKTNLSFDQILTDSDSEFDISTNDRSDSKVIAIFPTEVQSLSISLNQEGSELKFDIPNVNVFIKQEMREENSKKLMTQWLTLALELFREMFGFESGENNGNNNVAMKLPESFKNEFEFNKTYSYHELIEGVYNEAVERIKTRFPEANYELISGFYQSLNLDTGNADKFRVADTNNNLYYMNTSGDTVAYRQGLSPNLKSVFWQKKHKHNRKKWIDIFIYWRSSRYNSAWIWHW